MQNKIKLSAAFYKGILTGWVILAPIFIGLFWIAALRFSDISDFLSERSIRESGIEATSVVVEGDGRTVYPLIALGLLQFNDYDLKVSYLDNANVQRTSHVRFFSTEPIDQSQSAAVWYRPDDPNRIALSWSVNLGFGRLAYAGMHLLLGLLSFGLLFLAAKASLKKIALYKACAREYTREFLPAMMEPLVGADGKDTGITTYRYLRRDPEGMATPVMIPFKPLVVSNDGQDYVVSLRSKKYPEEPIVISSTLYEFDLTKDEVAHLTDFKPEFNTI